MPPPSSFYRSIYSEIEEVGWEHLVRLEEDLTYLSFRILDMKGQSHIMEIELPPNYPKCAPYVSADVPYVCDLQWSTKSRLKDVVHQFKEHLEKMQDFWSSLSDIDRALLVIDPKLPTRATSFRLISLGDDSSLLLSINVHNPKSLPECRFFGPDSVVQRLRKNWVKNSKRWMSEKPFPDNLANILETTLPGPPQASKDDQQVECGICYSLYLPIAAVELFILCASEIGYVPSQQQDSPLMFYLVTALTVLSRSQLKLTEATKMERHNFLSLNCSTL